MFQKNNSVPEGRDSGGVEMTEKRKVEIFSAGCPACDEAISLVQEIKCPSCEVAILDMNEPEVAKRARALDIRSVPAVVVDGQLAGCCQGRGPSRDELTAAGIGQTIK
jgi:glutaredoxin